MLHFANYERNANQIYNEGLPLSCQNVYHQKVYKWGCSLDAQWLGFKAFAAVVWVQSLVRGTEIPQAAQPSPKNKKNIQSFSMQKEKSTNN